MTQKLSEKYQKSIKSPQYKEGHTRLTVHVKSCLECQLDIALENVQRNGLAWTIETLKNNGLEWSDHALENLNEAKKKINELERLIKLVKEL